EMASRNKVDLPAASLEEWRRFYQFRDFDHFIEGWTAACRTMQALDDWSLMVENFVRNQARQNGRDSEAVVSGSHQVGKFSASEFLRALQDGAAVGQAKFGSRVRFIADIARHLPHTKDKVLELALQGHEMGIVIGLGLGGKELGHPPEDFADVYA